MFVAERRAQWGATAPARHSEPARERARHAIEDVIGCMVAGAGDEGAAAVRDAIRGWGAGEATVAGQFARAPAPFAALANGMAAHALDFDDTFMGAITHASAALVPALLALGEERETSGAAIVDAYIVGLELHAALGSGLIRSHYDHGWHATSTIGTMGTAGACARLLGLDAGRFAHALSLSTSMAGGGKVQFGSMAKPLHAGLAAKRAVEAATLAAAGVEGRLEAFEGAMGYLELCGGAEPAGWDGKLDDLGNPLAIERLGLMVKRFPCCAATHRALDCDLELMDEAGFGASDVAAVDVTVSHGHKRNLMYDDPRNELEARFSMNYCVAVALLFGTVRLGDFTPQAVRRPAVRALLGLTTMGAYDADAEQQDPTALIPTEVRVTLKDGRVLEASREMPRGSAVDPLDEGDRRAKFNDCCQGFLPDDDIAALGRDIAGIEDLDSIRACTRHLRFEAGADRGERFERRA